MPRNPVPSCQECHHRPGSDLCDLGGAEAATFERMRRIVLYEPGHYVFYEGHATLGLYVLCAGRVKLTRSTARGHQRLVAIVDPGMMIERHTFQDGAVHEVTCRALEPSRVCVIDRDQYLGLLARLGGLAVDVIKLRSRQMGVTLEEVDRSNEVFTDVFGRTGLNGGDSGYYVGAGLDLVLSKDVWGMMSRTWAVGEIGVEFKRFNSKNVTVAVPSTCAGALGAAAPGCTVRTDEVQITMLTVDIAPKIKFLEGNRFRPCIIPIGLDFHVISPPSNDTTVLDIGAQFGLGGELQLYKAFHLGLDGRFHLATGQTDTTNNFGTVGGYVGVAF